MRFEDPLIIGAGPAGSAAAIMLARGGSKPLILEATRETGDALCGGFISWRTIETLVELGIEAADLGGHPLSQLRLFSGQRQASAALPGAAIGISRRRLDTLLNQVALSAGAHIDRGVSVTHLAHGNVLTLKDGTSLAPKSLFVATGKHELRGLGRTRLAAPTLGLRVRLAPHPALTRMIGDAIELHLFEGGYAGLLLQEDGSANLCMAVRKDRLASAGGAPLALLALLGSEHPALAQRLGHIDASASLDAIAAIPYGWIGRDTQSGLFRLGDQAACIPSLAGEGNGLALASGISAAREWARGGDENAPTFQRSFAASVWRPVTAAKLLWHAAESPRLAKVMLSTTNSAPWLAHLAAALTRLPR